MEIGTALAVVQFVDQCVGYGVKLVRKCRDYRNAEDEARELLIAIEHNWMKTEAQLKFLTRIAESLGGEYLGMQARILAELEGKLKKAVLSVNQLSAAGQKWIEGHDEKAISARLKSIETLSPRNKALYALTKTSLEAIVDDLEKWQARYDPTWMLILRMETAVLNDELSKECQKPQSNQSSFIMTAKEMRDAAKLSISETSSAHQAVWLDVNSFDRVGPSSNTTHPLLFSLARLRNSTAQVMVDTMHCNPMADIPRTTKEVCNLARILSKVDPATFGVLKCRGIIKGLETVPDPPSLAKELPTFTFVFDVSPDLSNPRSLRSILQQAAAYSLNERFELAQQLTRSILYLHTARFVHKNIRPETIVVFQNAKSEIGAPFLLGFKKVRHEDGQTYGAGDGEWEKNLYRHPRRQGILPEEVYKMQHDIYSVGVILLEIGLWTSLVAYEAPTSSSQGPLVAVPSEKIAHLSFNAEKHRVKAAFHNKDFLEKLAEQELPITMGRKYTEIVLSCLQCLDEGENGESRAEYLDEDGVIVGVRFVESILSKIQQISF